MPGRRLKPVVLGTEMWMALLIGLSNSQSAAAE
jgi:hypothetical protein